MSIHKLTAGSGYDYLTRQVAAFDATSKGHGAGKTTALRALTRAGVVEALGPGAPVQLGNKVARRREPVGYRVGRHVRYRREAVEAWLEQEGR